VDWAKREKYDYLATFFEQNKSRIHAMHYQDHYYSNGTTYILYITGDDISLSDRELLKKFGFNIELIR